MDLERLLQTFHDGTSLNLYVLTGQGQVEQEFIRPLAPHLPEFFIKKCLKQVNDLDLLLPDNKNSLGKFRYADKIIVGWNANITIAGQGNLDRLAPLLGFDQFASLMKSLYFAIFRTWPQTELTDQGFFTGENLTIEPMQKNADYEGYLAEQELMEAVQLGNLDLYNQRFRSFIKEGNIGLLGAGKLRQEKNLAISATTLYTRAAIRGGLAASEAYALSDQIINRLEKDTVISNFYEYSRAIGEIFVNRVARSNRTSLTPLVYKAEEYIYHHYADITSVQEIADRLAVSRSYLQHLFKKETGMTLVAFINQVKVAQAKHELIFTNRTLSEICDDVGFSSGSLFSTTFKKLAGISPLTYRKQYK